MDTHDPEELLKVRRADLWELFDQLMDHLHGRIYEWSSDPTKQEVDLVVRIAKLIDRNISDTFLCKFARSKGWM